MIARRARGGKVTQLWLARLVSARGADEVSAKP